MARGHCGSRFRLNIVANIRTRLDQQHDTALQCTMRKEETSAQGESENGERLDDPLTSLGKHTKGPPAAQSTRPVAGRTV